MILQLNFAFCVQINAQAVILLSAFIAAMVFQYQQTKAHANAIMLSLQGFAMTLTRVHLKDV
jgi:hypothetical protein